MKCMYMKKMLNKSYANLKDFLDEEALVQTFCLGTEDCKEGILAFKQNVNLIFKVNNRFRNI